MLAVVVPVVRASELIFVSSSTATDCDIQPVARELRPFDEVFGGSVGLSFADTEEPDLPAIVDDPSINLRLERGRDLLPSTQGPAVLSWGEPPRPTEMKMGPETLVLLLGAAQILVWHARCCFKR
jgi:hypothetical protein